MSLSNRIRTSLVSFILIATISLSFNVLSASQPASNDVSRIERENNQREQLLRQQLKQQQRLHEQQRPITKFEVAKPVIKPLPKIKSRCFGIFNIDLQGADHLPENKSKDIINSYNNRCLSLNAINQLIKKLTSIYIEEGYVTSRVYIPKQNLSKGTLTLIAIEGKIDSLDLTNAPKINPRTAFPELKDKVLNLRDIEQGIEQVNRLSSNQVTLKLVPSSKTGKTIVQLSNEPRRRWQSSVNIDNSGQASTGEYQTRLYGSMDNLLGYNDFLSVSAQTSAIEGDSTNSSDNLTFRFEVPYGYWLFSIDTTNYRYKNEVQGQSTQFQSSGTSRQHTFNVQRIISRGQVQKTSVKASLLRKVTKNFIEDSLLSTSSLALNTATLNINQQRYYKNNKSLNLSASINHGLDSHNTNLLTDLSFSMPLKVGTFSAYYTTQYTYQYSDEDLLASEEMSIGSQYTVRGFKDESVTGIKGMYWRHEAKLLQPFKIIPEISPFIALDVGKVTTVENQYLAGIAMGAKMNKAGFSVSLTMSRALKRPSTFTKSKHQLYCSVSYWM
ncbi:MAG: ShlB/FhaC/HecB family hemolysin secretion/activation protein [Methylococcales bacterium]|nr:ShlB/FhaC/HecB family hemolysin secretion/activation protein [Methylococcales bacterium]